MFKNPLQQSRKQMLQPWLGIPTHFIFSFYPFHHLNVGQACIIAVVNMNMY